MKLENKAVYALIAAGLALLGFFFAFVVAGFGGFGSASLSGFGSAFAFEGGMFLVFFALLAGVAAVVLPFLRMNLYAGIAAFAAAAFLLIGAFVIPSGSFGLVSTGFGLWWSLIFFAASGTLAIFGDRFPLPGINVDKIREQTSTAFKNVANTARQQNDAFNESSAQQNSAPGDAPASFCTNCGGKLEDGAHFCPSCGSKV